MLKRIINISLLALIVFQAIGLINYLLIHQCLVKYEVKQSIENNTCKLSQLSIPLGELKQLNTDGNEFEYNGKSYDVKYFTITTSSLEVFVFEDADEDDIKEKMALLYNKKNKSGGENTIAKLLNLKYTSPNFQFHLKQVCTQKNNYLNYNTIFSNSIEGTTTPPPKI